MTVTKTAILPKDERGNDPNDFRGDLSYVEKIEIEKPVTALDSLLKLSSTNRLSEMEVNLKNDVYIFPDLALSGQISLFYGWPNTGKTIFFLRFITDAIREGRITSDKVIYVNADDSYKGLYTKTKIAAEYGFNMVSPAEVGVSHQNILDMLEGIAAENQADGIVVILDTLKKFADMMSKRSQSDLYLVLRKFIAKGGTVIIAGHANKHKDMEGKLVYEGTSDTMNDIDCAYSLYRMSSPEDEIQTVEFRREKDRGDVISKVTYQYRKSKGMHYMEMLNSITRLEDEDVEKLAKEAQRHQLEDRFESEIIFVTELLKANGTMNQTEIINALRTDSDFSGEITIRGIRKALKKMSGIAWISRRGEKNAKTYSLNGHESSKYRQASEGY